MAVPDAWKTAEEAGLPLRATPLKACEKGTPLDIGVLNKWKELPDDYVIKEGEKVRVEVGISPPLSSEELRNHCRRMRPEGAYMKLTKEKLIMEMIAPNRAEAPVGEIERRFEEESPRYENVEVLGVGKNWLLLGGASVGLLGLGYIATR